MRADRLLAIMLLLQTHGKLTTRALAARLEVSRRTILRDIDALCAAGVPLTAEGGHGGGVALDDRYQSTLAGMQQSEIRTLFISDSSALLGDLGMGDAAERTLLKLRGVLPPAHRGEVERTRQRLLIDPSWWWRDAQPLPLWEALQRAVFEDRKIVAGYVRHSGEQIERTLEPYSLVAKSSVWYLVARHDGELRTYRVTRLRSIELLDERFVRRADFDLPSYWQSQIQRLGEQIGEYRFTLRLRTEQLGFVREVVPGRYRQLGGEAAGMITLAINLSSLELAKMLVFGLGEGAEVVEPAALRDAVRESARAILAKP